jgi:hypothetical protein
VAGWFDADAGSRVRGGKAWSVLPGFRAPRPWREALLVKELRLQQSTLLIALGLAALYLATIRVPDNSHWRVGAIGAWMMIPLLMGCVCIAEERRGGTLEGALCLPAGKLSHFIVKLAVVLGFGVFFGALVPYELEQLRNGGAIFDDINLAGWMLCAAVIAAIGCYASSMSRTFLQALGVTILLVAWVILVFGLADVILRTEHIVSWAFDGHPAISWPGLIALCACLSYGNFKQPQINWRPKIRAGIIVLALVAVPCLIKLAALWWKHHFL